MLVWLRQLFGDPNGDNHEAVEALNKQKARSDQVKSDIEDMAEQLKASREAVQAKATAIKEEEERVTPPEGLQAAREASG
jgi:LmbE family N-acetylglucosaminyl deacetylase